MCECMCVSIKIQTTNPPNIQSVLVAMATPAPKRQGSIRRRKTKREQNMKAWLVRLSREDTAACQHGVLQKGVTWWQGVWSQVLSFPMSTHVQIFTHKIPQIATPLGSANHIHLPLLWNSAYYKLMHTQHIRIIYYREEYKCHPYTT